MSTEPHAVRSVAFTALALLGAAAPAQEVEVKNLGVAAYPYVGQQLDGDHLLFLAREYAQHADLNGDGDANDLVPVAADLTTGAVTSLGFAIFYFDEGWMHLSAGRAAFFAYEHTNGNTDLNGDGDWNDRVLIVHDLTTGVTTNTGLARPSPPDAGPFFSGPRGLFRVGEYAQGYTDLNGDGDGWDRVPHLVDLAAGTIVNLGVAASFGKVGALEGDLCTLSVTELAQARTDLNQDGDYDDQVAVAFSVTAPALRNLGVVNYLPPSLWGTRIVLPVAEFEVLADLNTDGDTNDIVLQVHDPQLGATVNTGTAMQPFARSESHLVGAVSEWQSIDLNGDGDTNDLVAHAIGPSPLTTRNLGLSMTYSTYAPTVFVDGGRVALPVLEAGQGGVDLNGDGDATDTVPHLVDLVSGAVSNLGRAGRVFVDGVLESGPATALLVAVSETQNGNVDLDGDGTPNDLALHLLDVESGRWVGLGPIGIHTRPSVSGGRLAFLRQEAPLDLNGDGDVFDVIPCVFDLETGASVLVPLASHEPSLGSLQPALDGSSLSFGVDEIHQAFTDLNGNGKPYDTIVHVARLAFDECGTLRPYGAGCAGPTAAVPDLWIHGCPRAGGGLVCTLVQGPPLASAFLVLGPDRAESPLGGGCTLNVSPLQSAVVGPLPLNAAGSLAFHATLPAGVQPGALAVQAFVDAGGGTFSNTAGTWITVR